MESRLHSLSDCKAGMFIRRQAARGGSPTKVVRAEQQFVSSIYTIKYYIYIRLPNTPIHMHLSLISYQNQFREIISIL